MLSYKSNHSNSTVRRTSTQSARLVVIVVVSIMPMYVKAQSADRTHVTRRRSAWGSKQHGTTRGRYTPKRRPNTTAPVMLGTNYMPNWASLHRDLEDGSYRTVRAEVINALETSLQPAFPERSALCKSAGSRCWAT